MLAGALEISPDEVPRYRQAYARAVQVVDAPDPAEAFRRGVRQSLQTELADYGLDEADVEEVVAQICYRAADLGYLLERDGRPLASYSEKLRSPASGEGESAPPR